MLFEQKCSQTVTAGGTTSIFVYQVEFDNTENTNNVIKHIIVARIICIKTINMFLKYVVYVYSIQNYHYLML